MAICIHGARQDAETQTGDRQRVNLKAQAASSKRFEISNLVSGLCLGVYAAASADDALDACARDAGYADYAASVLCADRPDRFATDAEWIEDAKAEMLVVEI